MNCSHNKDIEIKHKKFINEKETSANEKFEVWKKEFEKNAAQLIEIIIAPHYFFYSFPSLLSWTDSCIMN